MCTFQGSGLRKHQQNSTKGPQERERRMKIVAGGGKRKSEILGSPAEGCPAEVQRKGPSEMGCRVLRVQFRFLGTNTETEQKQNEERDE